jgi:hypothetical protein
MRGAIMSTRAVYTFKAKNEREYHIYKHHDGYPRCAFGFIYNALKFAWPLPRFEACEFAAAFVAGNKAPRGGDVYLTTSFDDHGDLSYRYEIEFQDGKLFITAYEAESYTETGAVFKTIFKGWLEEFEKFSKEVQS